MGATRPRPGGPWGRYIRNRDRFDALIYAEIADRRTEIAAGVDIGDRSDLLTMLLESRDTDDRPMTDQELRDNLVTMLLAAVQPCAPSRLWNAAPTWPPCCRGLGPSCHAGGHQRGDAAVDDDVDALGCR